MGAGTLHAGRARWSHAERVPNEVHSAAVGWPLGFKQELGYAFVQDRAVDEPERRTARRSWAVVRVAVSLGLLAVLVAKLDPREFAAVIARARWLPLLALFAVEVWQRVLAAYRWYVLARCTDDRVTLGKSIEVSFASNFLGQFLPGVVGIEALRVYGLSRTSDLATSFVSVVADRTLGLVSLVAMVFVGLLVAPVTLDPVITALAVAMVVALALGTVAVFNVGFRALLLRCLPARLERVLGRRLERFFGCLDAYRDRPWTVGWALALSFLTQIGRVAAYALGALALGVEAPLWTFVVSVPVVTFMGMLPISAGGLGVRDMSFVYFMELVGVRGAEAFAVSILVFVLTTVSTFPGAFFALRARRHSPEAVGSKS